MVSCSFVHTCICIVTVQVWLLLLISGVGESGTPPQIKQAPCPCHDHNQCRRLPASSTKDKEAIVFTNASSDFTKWDWKSVTTVIATADSDNQTVQQLMCYAHHEKTKFGFQVDPLPHLDDFNTTSNDTQNWMRKIAQTRLDLRADMVVVDLVDIFHSEDVDLKALIKLLHHVKDSISPTSSIEKTPVTLTCVVPWKPPCVQNDCSFSQLAKKTCDLFLLSPGSYLYLKGYGCKARATIPATKMALGVDEYAVRGVHEDKIILGVPWHGYEYSCAKHSPDSEICLLNEVKINNNTNDTKCEVDKRVKISLGDMITKHFHYFKKSKTDLAYKAPYYTYHDNASTAYKQVWFENAQSLRHKYQYAHDFGLKGVGIYTAEDLSQTLSSRVEGFNGGMWNWILHGIIQQQVTQPPPTKYHSDTVAGIAIGCMILGIVLGIVFMVILFRVRAKKKIDRPFRKDAMDEYHDDEDLNL
ncbi:di-N-acetylchitobiase-like [Gigantopelta aegis]|uniref:di-N-acetylchitobiase-like n=1 Tax=Gigantopelta aegis TaxID=1735272 RepID=UPI001B88CDBD|nr:di-N-acetylchitobiase-like [Gigantopelta aegis]